MLQIIVQILKQLQLFPLLFVLLLLIASNRKGCQQLTVDGFVNRLSSLPPRSEAVHNSYSHSHRNSYGYSNCYSYSCSYSYSYSFSYSYSYRRSFSFSLRSNRAISHKNTHLYNSDNNKSNSCNEESNGNSNNFRSRNISSSEEDGSTLQIISNSYNRKLATVTVTNADILPYSDTEPRPKSIINSISNINKIIRSLEIAYKAGDRSEVTTILYMNNISYQNIHELYPLIDRNIFNIGLTNIVRTMPRNETDALISKLFATGDVTTDTINIFLSHIVNKNLTRGELFFDKYYVRSRDYHTNTNSYSNSNSNSYNNNNNNGSNGNGNGRGIRSKRFNTVVPTIRSINIMLEGIRKTSNYIVSNASSIDTKAAKYFGLLEALDIQPDSSTISTLVRSANESLVITKLLLSARRSNVINSILLRCAVESYGQVGDLHSSLVTSFDILSKNGESVYINSRSADAIVAALMKNPYSTVSYKGSLVQLLEKSNNNIFEIDSFDVYYDNNFRIGTNRSCSIGMIAKDVAFSLVLRNNYNNETVENFLQSFFGYNKSAILPMTSKGYCILFGYLQREIKSCYESTDYTEDQIVSVRKQLNELRDLTLKQLITTINSKVQTESSFETSVTKELELNEKLIDAILRCFLGELSTAKVIWRSALIPLLKRATPQQIKMEERDYFYDYNLESLRVGLETLMFLSGRQYEPESALEVAMTISKRRKLFNSVNNGDRRATGRKTYQIENIYTERVYKTYCYGKRLYNQQQNRKQATFFDSKIAISEFLNKGIENSIRLELGVVEKSSGKGKIERIRIKF